MITLNDYLEPIGQVFDIVISFDNGIAKDEIIFEGRLSEFLISEEFFVNSNCYVVNVYLNENILFIDIEKE